LHQVYPQSVGSPPSGKVRIAVIGFIAPICLSMTFSENHFPLFRIML